MGLRSTDFICFYDWEQSRVIRRLDVAVKDGGRTAASSWPSPARHRHSPIRRGGDSGVFESGDVDEGEGVEDAFELLSEVVSPFALVSGG